MRDSLITTRTENTVIKTAFYLLFALVPLLLTPVNYELFEYNKMMAVYTLTVLIGVSWVVKMLRVRALFVRRTILDVPLLLFAVSQLVSTIFSMDPHVSWFGYYSRFNGGMLSVFSYLILYYALVSNTDAFTPSAKPDKADRKDSAIKEALLKLLRVGIVTAVFVALYGVLEHFGIDKHIWVQDVQSRVFSTLGQPNWLAAYLIALIPLTMMFALRALKRANSRTDTGFGLTSGFWGWSLVSGLFFLVLLYTRSRSGLLGLAVADGVFWAMVFVPFLRPPKPLHWSRRFIPAAALHAVFALIIFFNGTYVAQIDRYATLHGWVSLTSAPQKQTPKEATPSASAYVPPALESGGTESGTIRKYVWKGAFRAWNSTNKTRTIGTGTETFAFAFYQFRPVEHNRTSEWDYLYNKAHNEYLNYLTTTGIFGLGSYILFLSLSIWCFVRLGQRKREDGSIDFLIPALFAGWTSVLVTNFFGFSVVITQLVLFLFPAMALSLDEASYREKKLVSSPGWLLWLIIAIGSFLLFAIASFWYADKRFAKGYQYDRAGLYAQATPGLRAAIAINPREPLYHDELATNYAALAVTAATQSNATEAATFAREALSESNTAIRISPMNVNFLKSRTKVYYTLSSLDPSLNAVAITTLKKALLLSPNDPKIYYNLAILAGREGKTEDAITYLLKAKALKNDYRDAYNALAIFYGEIGKKDKARAVIEDYLRHINPQDQQFQEFIAK